MASTSRTYSCAIWAIDGVCARAIAMKAVTRAAATARIQRLMRRDYSCSGPGVQFASAQLVRAFFFSVLGYFLTPAGVVLMAVLDASLVFFLPLGIDFVVIVMSARRPDLFWLHAILAALGSVAGAGGTLWIGRQAGEHGLTRLVSPRRLARVKAR